MYLSICCFQTIETSKNLINFLEKKINLQIFSLFHQAKRLRYQKIFEEKVVKVFIHGYLHLLGYDHIKNKDYSKMLKEEYRLYKSVKLKLD